MVAAADPPKRGRGRPRKNPLPVDAVTPPTKKPKLNKGLKANTRASAAAAHDRYQPGRQPDSDVAAPKSTSSQKGRKRKSLAKRFNPPPKVSGVRKRREVVPGPEQEEDLQYDELDVMAPHMGPGFAVTMEEFTAADMETLFSKIAIESSSFRPPRADGVNNHPGLMIGATPRPQVLEAGIMQPELKVPGLESLPAVRGLKIKERYHPGLSLEGTLPTQIFEAEVIEPGWKITGLDKEQKGVYPIKDEEDFEFEQLAMMKSDAGEIKQEGRRIKEEDVGVQSDGKLDLGENKGKESEHEHFRLQDENLQLKLRCEELRAEIHSMQSSLLWRFISRCNRWFQ